MLAKIKNVIGKVKEFFLEVKIDEKSKEILDNGIAAVKKSSEEIKETVEKVSDNISETVEKYRKSEIKPQVIASKDISETEKVIEEAAQEHVISDMSKDIGLNPICSNNATSEALKEARKIATDKIIKKDAKCKTFKKKCVIDEVAAEKSEEANAPTYIRGTFKKVELTRMQEAIDSGNPYDTTFIAKELNRDPLSIAKKMKQLAAKKTEA